MSGKYELKVRIRNGYWRARRRPPAMRSSRPCFAARGLVRRFVLLGDRSDEHPPWSLNRASTTHVVLGRPRGVCCAGGVESSARVPEIARVGSRVTHATARVHDRALRAPFRSRPRSRGAPPRGDLLALGGQWLHRGSARSQDAARRPHRAAPAAPRLALSPWNRSGKTPSLRGRHLRVTRQ